MYTEYLSNITFNYLCEILPNYLCHFLNHKSFSTAHLLCIFLVQTLRTFYKSRPSKCKFSYFPLLALKFTKFLMSFFKQKVSFFFEVWIFFQCHEKSLFCTFLAETLHAIEKSNTSKCKFLDLPLLSLKFTKLLMSFLKPRVDFSVLLYFFI